MEKSSKIVVFGHNGMVGSAIVRKLRSEGYTNIITKSRKELDLTNQASVFKFFELERPEYIFLAAAKVGGIGSNSKYKADFIYQNLMIQTNIIHASHITTNVKKLLFLGSSCIYPRDCPQPIKEEYLMTSALEKTNDAYATAKIAGIKMCQSYNEQYKSNFISVMPTNLYGPRDSYDLDNSHVLPALIRKFHEGKLRESPSVMIWGSGTPKREFLCVDDLADACLFLMLNYNDPEVINVGSGDELTIRQLSLLIREVVGYKGNIEFDSTKPDGTPRKFLDSSKINNLGWSPKIGLKEGIKLAYEDYVPFYHKHIINGITESVGQNSGGMFPSIEDNRY